MLEAAERKGKCVQSPGCSPIRAHSRRLQGPRHGGAAAPFIGRSGPTCVSLDAFSRTVTITPVSDAPSERALFAIYEGSDAHPDQWVVSKWLMFDDLPEPVPATEPHAVRGSLEEARKTIPRGMLCSLRTSDDPPNFVELWVPRPRSASFA